MVLAIAIFVGVLDQLAKFLIRKHFVLHDAVTIIPGIFDLRYIRNTGAAWGMFADGTIWLSLFSIIMLVVLIVFRKSFLSDSLIDRICLGLLCGGIVGNLIDRVWLRYVVDFLDFYWKNHHFPAFNVADSAICIAVFLYIISQMRISRKT